jgi:hypothetical protein
MYFKTHTNTAMADTNEAHKDFVLNEYVFQAVHFLSGYRSGMWCSSSANKHVLKATCTNTVVIIPTANPVTEHHHHCHHNCW